MKNPHFSWHYTTFEKLCLSCGSHCHTRSSIFLCFLSLWSIASEFFHFVHQQIWYIFILNPRRCNSEASHLKIHLRNNYLRKVQIFEIEWRRKALRSARTRDSFLRSSLTAKMNPMLEDYFSQVSRTFNDQKASQADKSISQVHYWIKDQGVLRCAVPDTSSVCTPLSSSSSSEKFHDSFKNTDHVLNFQMFLTFQVL